MRFGALIVLLALPSLAFAAPVVDEATKARSKAHFELARNHKALGQYDQAITEYHEAHKLFPAPDFLYNIAVVYRLKGDRASALAFYKRYLDEAPDGKGAGDARTAVDQLTREMDSSSTTPRPPPQETPPQVLAPMDPWSSVTPSPTVKGAEPSPARVVDVTPARREAPARSRVWVWGVVVGAVVVVGLAVGLGVGLGVKRDAPVRDTSLGAMEFPFP